MIRALETAPNAEEDADVACRKEEALIKTGNPRLAYVNPAVVKTMRGQLRSQTAECVMDTFGISIRTWVKMRDGQPIRKSVAERLLDRIQVGW